MLLCSNDIDEYSYSSSLYQSHNPLLLAVKSTHHFWDDHFGSFNTFLFLSEDGGRVWTKTNGFFIYTHIYNIIILFCYFIILKCIHFYLLVPCLLHY